MRVNVLVFVVFWLTLTKAIPIPLQPDGAPLSALAQAEETNPAQPAVPAFLQTVIPGVNLSPSSIFTNFSVLNATMGGLLYLPSQLALFRWVMFLQQNLTRFVGQPKPAALDTLNQFWHNSLKGSTPLPAGYEPFGSGSLTHYDGTTEADLCNTLALFLKTNAFYASAMGMCHGHPCIRSRTGNGWFARTMASVNKTAYHLVDADFDNQFRLTSFHVFRTVNGQETEVNVTRLQALEHLVGMLNYYSECLHTVIHTLQYVGGAAFIDASSNSEKMRKFARTFAMNVFKTYNDVVGLDLKPANLATTPPTPPGVLVGGLFDANRDGILNTLSQVVADWTKHSDAREWVDKFALAGFDKKTSKRLEMLEAFQAQAALIGPYTNEVVGYMKRNADYKFADAQTRLRTFFANAGRQADGTPTFALQDLKSWLQLQAVTSIFHGQTLSFTRLMATKAAFTTFSPVDTFTTWDSFYYRATSPTIIGAQPDRFVLGKAPLEVDGVTDNGLLAVIGSHTEKTIALKTAELARWRALGLVEKQGWIVSDFFPEGWDGRQLTINTYL